ncbi:MAG: CHAD domain-containing protein [Tardiphaga sp.]
MTRPCLASVRRHHAAACRGDAEAVHQIRIALTRFRAARKFFAAMTRDAAWPKLEAAIDWLDSALGAARDSDVATGYAKTKLRDHLDAQDGADLARQVRQTHRRLASVLRSKRCDRLIAALEQWIDNGPWRTAGSASEEKRRNQPLADYAPDRLRQWKHRLARKSVGSLGKERWRHRLRIAAKRYRYMREALAAIGLPERRTGLRERVAAQSVQKALGDLRDLQRFRKGRFRSVGAKFYRRRKKQLLHKARDALRQFD